MRDERIKRRWMKTEVAQRNHFVQILAILPFVWMFSPEERKASFFPRIFDGQLPLTCSDSTFNGGTKWEKLPEKRPFWATLATTTNRTEPG